MSIWAIRRGYRYDAVQFVKATTAMVFYIENWSGKSRETRSEKSKFLDWRGSEDEARAIVARLTSALAERDRRIAAAHKWFDERRRELTAQGIEAATADTTGTGVAVGESPVAKPCAQGEGQ